MTKEPLPNVACPSCGAVGHVLRASRRENVDVRGESIDVDRIFRHCEACGAEFENTSDPDWKLQAFAEYRARKGMLTPDKVRSWRKSLGLTQRDVTMLLGWGEATLGRYENGSLQTDAHETQLRGLIDPALLLKRLEQQPSLFQESKRFDVTSRLRADALASRLKDVVLAAAGDLPPDVMNGCRTFSMARTINVFLALAERGELKTKLNKLLFYADFMHFRDHGTSITGLQYAHADYGPVPHKYEAIIAAFVEMALLRVTEKEFGDMMGEEISAVAELDPNSLAPTELQVIQSVKKQFKGWSSTRITRYSHKEQAWQQSTNGQLISYVHAATLSI